MSNAKLMDHEIIAQFDDPSQSSGTCRQCRTGRLRVTEIDYPNMTGPGVVAKTSVVCNKCGYCQPVSRERR